MRALITGITGMDGSHLADLLVAKGYEVHGLVRRCSRPVTERIAHLEGEVTLHQGDLLDQVSLDKAVCESQPDEVYHLAAQSFVGTSWEQPVLTAEITGLGTLRMLDAVRSNAPEARFYQASSSEMFGNSGGMQDEHTPFAPRSPYGAAKAYAHHIAVNYRESYGMHVSCGILFNHEGERRGSEFVTRKIARQAAEIAAGTRLHMELGNLTARRDWGYAPDYVEAMWMMLQQERPDDFVIATGETHSVEDFVREAHKAADVTCAVSPRLDQDVLRPAELDALCGDARKAHERLGWSPRVKFPELVERMVRHELHALDMVAPAKAVA